MLYKYWKLKSGIFFKFNLFVEEVSIIKVGEDGLIILLLKFVLLLLLLDLLIEVEILFFKFPCEFLLLWWLIFIVWILLLIFSIIVLLSEIKILL